MKKMTFSEPVTGRAFFDFIPLFTKKDFNDTVINIQAVLKRHGINCKTSSLKEWLSKAAGYNSAAHLLSELPLAFNGMRAIYKLNQMLNQNTQWAIYFEALNYQPLEDSSFTDSYHYEVEVETDPSDTVIDEDYHLTISEQVKKKVDGTSYEVIPIHFDDDAFYDYWGELPDSLWHYCFRASSLRDMFPTYHTYREISFPDEDACFAVKSVFGSFCRSGTDGSNEQYSLDDIFFEMESEESVFRGYLEEIPIEFIHVVSSFLLTLADEQKVTCSEGLIIRSMLVGNAKGFASWLARQKKRDDLVSDLAIDADRDPEFANNATTYADTMRYLDKKAGLECLGGVREAGRLAWKEFLSLKA